MVWPQREAYEEHGASAVKILVTFAMETEFAPWRELRDFKAGKWAAPDIVSAEIGSADVGVLLTGIGPKLAKDAAARVLAAEAGAVRVCVSSGLAGGLRAQHAIGGVLAAKAAISETGRGGDASGVESSSDSLVSFASQAGATVVERFFSSARVIASAAEKKHVGELADAAEMESFGVLRAARDAAVPAVAIRAISDTVDEDLPLDMNAAITEEGQVSVTRVVGQLARHPQSLPAVMRIGKNSKQAAKSLCAFLDRYVTTVGEAMTDLESRAASARK